MKTMWPNLTLLERPTLASYLHLLMVGKRSSMGRTLGLLILGCVLGLSANAQTLITAIAQNGNENPNGDVLKKNNRLFRNDDRAAELQDALDRLPASGGKVELGCGVYKITKPIRITRSSISLIGADSNCVTLRYVGVGSPDHAAVVEIGKGFGGSDTFNVKLAGMSIVGNRFVSRAILIRAVHHSIFSDLNLRDVTGCALETKFAVSNSFYNIRVSSNERDFDVQPESGICLGEDAPGARTTSSTLIDPVINGVSGTGILLSSADNVTITSGESEGNGTGIQVGVPEHPESTWSNSIIGMDLENNQQHDAVVYGYYTILQNVISTGRIGTVTGIKLAPTARKTIVLGGNLYGNPSILIELGAQGTRVVNSHFVRIENKSTPLSEE